MSHLLQASMENPTAQVLHDHIMLLVAQHRLGTKIPDRQKTVRSLRKLIAEQIQATGADQCESLRDIQLQLARLPHGDRDYFDYCLREIGLIFELAGQITKQHQGNPELIRILVDDLPILRPFDYGNDKIANS